MIKQAGGEATFVQADLLESSQVGELIDRTVSVYGRLDYACNNAGIAGTRVPLIEYPEDQWDLVVDTDLKAVSLCMKYEIPQMLKQGRAQS